MRVSSPCGGRSWDAKWMFMGSEVCVYGLMVTLYGFSGVGVWDLGWMLMGFMRYGVFSRLKLFVVRFRCLFMGLKSGGHMWDSYRPFHLRGVHLWDSISMKPIPWLPVHLFALKWQVMGYVLLVCVGERSAWFSYLKLEYFQNPYEHQCSTSVIECKYLSHGGF